MTPTKTPLELRVHFITEALRELIRTNSSNPDPYRQPLTDAELGAKACAIAEAVIDAMPKPVKKSPPPPTGPEPEWIVNDMGELGVRIGTRCFFLYKARNIEYGEGHLYRPVYKREFGEVCLPPTERHPDRGVRNSEGGYTFGNPDDWMPLPPKGDDDENPG